MSEPTAPERGSNFFTAFRFLPRAKREALGAVYAYCRLIDDLVDSGALTRAQAAEQLEFWRGEIARLYAGRPTHPLARRLRPHVEAYRLPREAFLEMIRGCAMDLEGAAYATPEALEDYMRGVAASVGWLAVEIFGYRHTPPADMRAFATLFGYAFQLTNIIRDVGADLELGRVYIPASDLEAAGVSRRDLAARRYDPAFQALMARLYERAKDYYRRARVLVDPRDRAGLLPAEIMAHVYEGLLDDMRQDGFRVLFGRHTLSRWRKLMLVGRACIYCWGPGKKCKNAMPGTGGTC
ncbi:MAG: squalene/phytoene synthase family protein [Elusimicrobia bacterium]|nr:squalene/phytoene synthase family protein [Elusimicrobiota bacterium]